MERKEWVIASIRIYQSDSLNSLLLLKDKNILVSAGNNGTKLWNIYDLCDINLIKEFKDTYWRWNEGLCRLKEDIIAVEGKDFCSLKLISISQKEKL